MPNHKLEDKTDLKLILPKMSKVVMLNDNYTTMEFVVMILMEVFDKNFAQANAIMLKIHHDGQGICGIYPHDIAQTKVYIAKDKVKEAGFPLRILIEDE